MTDLPPRGYLLEYNGLEQPNKECIAKLLPPGKKKNTLPPFTWQIAMLEPCFAGRNLGGYGSVQATPKIHWTNFYFTGIPICKYARMYGQQERFNGNLFCDAGPNGLVWSIPNCSCRIFFNSAPESMALSGENDKYPLVI